MRRKVVLLVTAGLAAILLVGGAVRVLGRKGPDRTAQQFVDATRQSNTDVVLKLLTKQARENVKSGNGDLSVTPKGDTTQDDAIVGKPVVDGETAVVPVEPKDRANNDSYRLRMRREDNEWRVYAITVAPDGGPEMTIDLEHPEDFAGELVKAVLSGPGTKAIGEAIQGLGAGLEAFGKGLQRAGEEMTGGKEDGTASPR